MKPTAQFRLLALIFAMTAYFPVWHSRCTKASCTVFV